MREAAVRVLLELDAHSATLGTAIERERGSLTDPRDRALLIELAAGTLRWRARLDALLTACARRPAAAIDPPVRELLRISAYQLEYLTRVPPHAVVHEAVETARRLGRPRAAGFVNAVLRGWLRRRATLRLPPRPSDDGSREEWIAYLSTSLSHPAWLVGRWLDRVGPDATRRWCEYDNQTPLLAARPSVPDAGARLADTLAARGVTVEPLRYVTDGWQLPAGVLGDLPAEVRHELYLQDEASQVLAHAVGARPGETVLDLCASPGGKSLVLAADMDARGRLVSCDARPGRVRLLATTLRHAGLPARVVQLDAARPLPFGPIFDRVLVDAPCSGLGVLARDPDLKWRRREDDLGPLAAQQAAILQSAAAVVRPGGTLVYATCSSEPEETDAVIESFLARSPFDRGRPPAPAAVPRLAELLTPAGTLRTWPFAHGLDAFFAAFLQRTGVRS